MQVLLVRLSVRLFCTGFSIEKIKSVKAKTGVDFPEGRVAGITIFNSIDQRLGTWG